MHERTAMHEKYKWLPAGEDELPDHLKPEVAAGIIELANSTDPNKANDLIEIAMTRGKQNIRIALEGVALVRETKRAAEEANRATEFRRLESLLVKIAFLTFLAAAIQATAAVLPLLD